VGHPGREAVDTAPARLSITKTNDFDLTITQTGQRLGDEPADQER
jgi:hypothetical protein